MSKKSALGRLHENSVFMCFLKCLSLHSCHVSIVYIRVQYIYICMYYQYTLIIIIINHQPLTINHQSSIMNHHHVHDNSHNAVSPWESHNESPMNMCHIRQHHHTWGCIPHKLGHDSHILGQIMVMHYSIRNCMPL